MQHSPSSRGWPAWASPPPRVRRPRHGRGRHLDRAPRRLGHAADASSDELEDALMVRINEARAAHGLRKVWNFDACTDQLAEEWGARIARTGLFEHRDQHEVIRKCDNSWAGETLVRGSDLTPHAMVDLWLNSPGHREILLSPRAKRAGVAIDQDTQGRVIGVVTWSATTEVRRTPPCETIPGPLVGGPGPWRVVS